MDLAFGTNSASPIKGVQGSSASKVYINPALKLQIPLTNAKHESHLDYPQKSTERPQEIVEKLETELTFENPAQKSLNGPTSHADSVMPILKDNLESEPHSQYIKCKQVEDKVDKEGQKRTARLIDYLLNQKKSQDSV